MIDTIVNSFDIWTDAQGIKSRTRVKSVDNISLVGVSKLKDFILELAVTGKLVMQDPNDEPASELLKKIAKERERLIKEGKLKEEKPLPEINTEGLSITLPKGWVFAHWNEIALKIGDIDHKMPEQVKAGYAYISPRDFLPNNMIDLKSAKKISEKDYLNLSEKIKPELGDIIYPRYGTIGENRLVTTTDKFLASYSCCIIKTMHGFIDPKYQFFYSISESVKKQAKKAENKTTQANVGIKSIQAYIIPLPPISEQQRIVAKVDELMALCDKLEEEQFNNLKTHQVLVKTLLETLTQAADANELQAAWERLSAHFDTLFCTDDSIDQLKQTILQLAVMGKLVKQDPNDEPASELLKKITKTIKTDKINLQEENDYPFKISSNWEWVKLGKIHNVTSSKRIHAADYVDKGIPFFRSKEIGELGRGDEISTDIFITENRYNELKNLPGFPQKNDLMLASIGASIGNNWICDDRKFYYKDGNITKIESHQYSNMRYLQIFIKSPLLVKQITDDAAGSAYNALTIIKIKNLLYPVPPLNEQQQIVAKVDELFEICDSLKEKLSKSQNLKVLLSKTIVEKAVQLVYSKEVT